MIVVMAGLPGTGKTTLARELARRMDGRVLSKDEFRHAIFLPKEIEYSTPQDDFCQRLMMETAAFLLERERSRIVFLDGRPFSRGYQIANVRTEAASLHQPWRIVECVCPAETAKQRLAEDAAHPAGNRDFQLYLQVKERFEAIPHPKTVINTNQALENSVTQALAAIRRDTPEAI